MKAVKLLRTIGLVISIGMTTSVVAFSQTVGNEKTDKNARERIAKVDIDKTSVGEKPDSATVGTADVNVVKDDDEDSKEAKKTVAYYSNYLEEYRLGPNDIISIEVFGQCPDYCKTDASVPPTARMSYPLIREGVFVGGKTTLEVADDVTKKLEEYIIDPKVNVTLVRPGSARYAVMGKVGVPGVRVMDRRVSINEAILEAGGIAKGGSKKKILIARFNSQGLMERQQVDLPAIEAGKKPTIFLRPGDQVIVGSKGFTWDKFLKVMERASFARILFGSPF